jgi:hypothetical protein
MKMIFKNNSKISALMLIVLLAVSSCVNVSPSSTSSASSSSSVSSSSSQLITKKLIAVELERSPTRLSFTPNEPITAVGGFLGLYYDDFSTRLVPTTDDMIDLRNLNASSVGVATITLKYVESNLEFIVSYDVQILPYLVPLNGINIDIKNLTVTVDQSFSLTLEVTPLNAYFNRVVWSSSNPLIASVDQTGLVTTKNVGEVIITVNVNDSLTASTKLYVIASPSPQIDLDNNPVSELRGGDWIPIANGDDLMMIGVAGVSYIFAADNPTESVEFSGVNLTPGLSGKYYLLNSIDLSDFDNEDYAWSGLVEVNSIIPIGFSFSDNALINGLSTPFTGEFDGNNNKISGMKIQMNSNYDLVGLFSSISGGEVYDLEIELSSIDEQTYNYDQVGLLAGYATNTIIKNVTIDRGSVIARDLVGGLVGYIDSSSVEDSSSSAIVDGTLAIGGLIGEADFSEIIDSSSTGAVNGVEAVGGLVGFLYESEIEGSHATGIVSGSVYVGGLLGESYGGSAAGIYYYNLITNSYATGSASGEESVGGLIGKTYITKLMNTYASGTVTGTDDYTGGLVGKAEQTEISNSYANGMISGEDYTGGLVGYLVGTSDLGSDNNYLTKVTSSYYSPELSNKVSGRNYVGGLIGSAYNANVFSSYSTGNVEGVDYVGGLIGKTDIGGILLVTNIEVVESYASGNVTSTSDFYKTAPSEPDHGDIGGLIGEAYYTNVGRSYSLGNVTATNASKVGGLIGHSLNSFITLANASGNVNGDNIVGGLIGKFEDNWNSTSFINNSFAEGNVTAAANKVGGLVGEILNSSINSSFATGDVTAISSTSVGGLIGSAEAAIINNSYSETVVIGNDEVGGLIGAISGSSAINNSYSQGTVKSITGAAGGFVASLYGSVITNSYFIGNVEAVLWSGGFIGFHNDSDVTNSYVIANVKRLSGTDTNIGYFVGFNAGVASVFINNYYNSDAVIVDISNNPLATSTQPSGISAKNTAEMKNIETFTTAPSDWDFQIIWKINPSKNSGYPELAWQD